MSRHGQRASRALVMLFLLAGCASPSSPPPVEPSEVAPYVIGVSDRLRVTVWKHDDVQVEAPVRRDGKISVPLLNDVQAAGLTPEQLSRAIATKLSVSLKNPEVTVTVVSPDSQVVTVIGGVLRAGRIPLLQKMGVLDAIAAAGGFSAWANKDSVRVIRSVGHERFAYVFDYEAFVRGEPSSDILLERGDVVVVPE